MSKARKMRCFGDTVITYFFLFFFSGRYSEAALILFHCGEVNKALEMAEKGEDNAMSARCLVLKAQKLIAEQNKEQKLSENLHGTNNTEEVRSVL